MESNLSDSCDRRCEPCVRRRYTLRRNLEIELDKSKLTGDTVKFSPAGELMRITGNGDSYEFKLDGSDTKTRFGTASWKKIDDNTLEEIDKVKGNVESKTTWTLSSDGKTLTAHVTGR